MIGSDVAEGSIEAPERDSRPRQLLWLFVAIKIGLFGTALLANQLLPFDTHLYDVNLVWPLRNLPAVFEAFNTWDTQHYLLLSQQGYGTNPMSNAFYPLYPFLIWLCTPLFLGRELIAALVIANLVSLAVPIYMYRLGTLFLSKEQSYRATLLLLAFPTAFYLSAAYTESLFLLFSIAAFYHLFRGEVARASVFCFLLPLVRAQALLFVLPLAVMFVQAAMAKPGPKAGLRYALRTFLPPAMAAALGACAYLLFSRIALGGFFAGIDAQRLFIADNSIANIFALDRWFVRNFVDVDFALHGYTNSIIDRVAFALCLPLLFWVYRTQERALFVFALLTLLVPALAGSFMSYTRFLLAVFPIFMAGGALLKHAERLAVVMFSLQVLLFVLHATGRWVA